MLIAYDTEFLEDGHTIELISIGMVAEDGRELYAVNEGIETDPLWTRICEHRWLMANVIPHLPLRDRNPMPEPLFGSNNPPRFYLSADSNLIMSRRMVRNMVRDFLAATPDAELWAWYAAYDHVALAQLFGRIIDLPPGCPMWTNDVQQEAHRLGVDVEAAMPPSGTAHNALDDARHVMAMIVHLRRAE